MGKAFCVANLETNDDGTQDLVVRIPWDQDDLLDVIQNSSGAKKSVSLAQGDIVAEGGRRGSIAYYAQIGPHRLELKGGVNIWCSRPEDVGVSKTRPSNHAAVKDVKELSADIAAAQAIEAATWHTLEANLLAPNGTVAHKAGSRIRKDTFTDLYIAGFRPENEPAKPEAKHVVLTPAQSAEVTAKGIDLKATELGIAGEKLFTGKGK